MNFTAEEYEDAIRNKREWEVVVRGLGTNTTDDSLFKFFKNNGIRIVQVNLLKNEQGATGIAFVLCINIEEKHKAIELGKRGMTL
jgi:RNA recognition motif-containing protein